MAVKSILLGLLLTFGVAQCISSDEFIKFARSRPQENSGLGIFDGKTTTIEKHPYLVAYLIGGQLLCAGAILTPSWTITIGDCASSLDTTATVLAGSSDGSTGTSYNIKSIVLHPSYGLNYFDYDYGCIQITKTFKWSAKTKPVKLPKKDPKGKSLLNVAGWGDTSAVDGTNGQLRQGTMTWLPKTTCSTFFTPYGLTWTDRMACAYNKGKVTLCQGDFGDPFIQKGVLVGLMVTGLNDGFCTKDASPLILSDIYTVAAWIKSTTGAKYEA